MRKPVQDRWVWLRYVMDMPHKTAVILRAADIDRAEVSTEQRLNPRSPSWDGRSAAASAVGRERRSMFESINVGRRAPSWRW